MGHEVVIAVYRPKPGQDRRLEALIARHEPTLRASGLVTARPSTLVRSGDGSYLEIFEWKDGDAAGKAHHDPRVGEVWGAMSEVADFASLSSLPEASTPFSHFRPVDGVTR